MHYIGCSVFTSVYHSLQLAYRRSMATPSVPRPVFIDDRGRIIVSGYHIERRSDGAYEATVATPLEELELNYGRRSVLEAGSEADILSLIAAQRIIADWLHRITREPRK